MMTPSIEFLSFLMFDVLLLLKGMPVSTNAKRQVNNPAVYSLSDQKQEIIRVTEQLLAAATACDCDGYTCVVLIFIPNIEKIYTNVVLLPWVVALLLSVTYSWFKFVSPDSRLPLNMCCFWVSAKLLASHLSFRSVVLKLSESLTISPAFSVGERYTHCFLVFLVSVSGSRVLRSWEVSQVTEHQV